MQSVWLNKFFVSATFINSFVKKIKSLDIEFWSHYSSSGGIESMAACLRESTARVYFSVWASPLCLRMLATVLMLAPLLNRFVPQLWRAQCQVICFWMPARATQWRKAFRHMVCDGKGKMIWLRLPSFGWPMRAKSPSLSGMTTPLAPLWTICL